MILAPVWESLLMACTGQTNSHIAVSHCIQVEGINWTCPFSSDLMARMRDRSGLHSFIFRREQLISHIWQPLHFSG
jgi:hypothetical protein